jgi:hypothetical protein
MTHTINEHTIFNLQRFKELAEKQDPTCISIYNPTFKTGKGVLEDHAIISLKNITKQVEQRLSDIEVKQNKIDNLLKPLYKLIEDKSFWTRQSEGLAIFLTYEEMILYKVPIDFKPYYYISDHFYMLPILPMLNINYEAYLLAFSLKNVGLYEISSFRINPVKLETLPQSPEEIVGHDFMKSQLNASAGSHQNSIIHGQTSNKDIREKEVLKFMQEINKEVNSYLKDTPAPLILACDNQHAGEYKKINTYHGLVPEHLPGSPEQKSADMLLNEAMPVYLEELYEYIQLKIKDFKKHINGERSLLEINEIIPNAIQGRIDTLFVQKNKDCFGLYDIENYTTIIDNNKKLQNASLYNLAAIHTILNRGKVFLLESKEMPLPTTSINAFLRY